MSRLVRTVIVRNPETFVAEALVEGSEVPEWAADLIHEDDLTDAEPEAEDAEDAEVEADAEPEVEAPAKRSSSRKTGK